MTNRQCEELIQQIQAIFAREGASPELGRKIKALKSLTNGHFSDALARAFPGVGNPRDIAKRAEDALEEKWKVPPAVAYPDGRVPRIHKREEEMSALLIKYRYSSGEEKRALLSQIKARSGWHEGTIRRKAAQVTHYGPAALVRKARSDRGMRKIAALKPDGNIEVMKCNESAIHRVFTQWMIDPSRKLRRHGGNLDVRDWIEDAKKILPEARNICKTSLYGIVKDVERRLGICPLSAERRRTHICKQGVGYRAQYANEVWEHDFMLSDIWVRTDDATNVFRPIVACWYDKYSAAPAAMIACRPEGEDRSLENTEAFASSLFLAITRISDRNPICGTPERIWFDNGRVQLSNSVRAMLERLKIDYSHCNVRSPWEKSIERFFGTVHQNFEAKWILTTGANVYMPSTYKGHEAERENDYVLKQVFKRNPHIVRRLPTLAEYNEALEAWIETYLWEVSEHQNMKFRPAEMWLGSVTAERAAVPPLEQLAVALMPLAPGKRGTRTVRNDSIEVEGIRYHLPPSITPGSYDNSIVEVRVLYGDHRRVLCVDPDTHQMLFWCESAPANAALRRKYVQNLKKSRRDGVKKILEWQKTVAQAEKTLAEAGIRNPVPEPSKPPLVLIPGAQEFEQRHEFVEGEGWQEVESKAERIVEIGGLRLPV